MKIVFVTQNYLPFTGGIETHVAQVAQALSLENEVTVLAVNFAPPTLLAHLSALATNLLASRHRSERRDGAVRVVSLGPTWLDRLRMIPLLLRVVPLLRRWFYHGLNRLTHPFYAWSMSRRLRREIRRADVVHAMGGGDLGWACEAVARKCSVPVVCTPFVHPRQWGDGPDDVAYYRRCHAVIGLVQTDADYLASLGVPAEKLRVIGVSPSLPDQIDPTALRRILGLSAQSIVLYVGRMMKQKGASALIAAAPLVWREVPETQFVFIGPGNAEELRIFEHVDKRIRYLGRVSEAEKAQALAGCDIFCMPSTSEILPTVYLEAWSLGKPVIGGTAPGLLELIEGNGAGEAVGQSSDAIAAALVSSLKNPSLRERYGSAGRALVERCYSVKAVVAQLEQLYRDHLTQTIPAI